METMEKRFEECDYQKIIASGSEFTDKVFPPNNVSLGVQKDILEVIRMGVTWKRPKEVYTNEFDIFRGIDINDIVQEDLGDCYMLSAMSGLAEFPNRVEKIFLVSKKNESGSYALEIYVCGVPRTIVVDDKFPYFPSQRRWSFTHSRENEIWVMLLEKAWAKAYGCYGILAGGDSRESLSALTGAPTVLYLHEKISKSALWKEILSADKNNYFCK